MRVIEGDWANESYYLNYVLLCSCLSMEDSLQVKANVGGGGKYLKIHMRYNVGLD